MITWDEPKRKVNLKKHGFDFIDAESVFSGVIVTFADDRRDYSETRWLTFGLLKDKVVAIAHTESGRNIRIISMRKAERYETEAYFSEISDGLGAN